MAVLQEFLSNMRVREHDCEKSNLLWSGRKSVTVSKSSFGKSRSLFDRDEVGRTWHRDNNVRILVLWNMIELLILKMRQAILSRHQISVTAREQHPQPCELVARKWKASEACHGGRFQVLAIADAGNNRSESDQYSDFSIEAHITPGSSHFTCRLPSSSSFGAVVGQARVCFNGFNSSTWQPLPHIVQLQVQEGYFAESETAQYLPA